MLIDLHAHSTASDGTDAPAGVVAAAARAGLDVVALTDHDTTAGWADAARRLHTYGAAPAPRRAGRPRLPVPSFEDAGFNYRLSDVQAGILLGVVTAVLVGAGVYLFQRRDLV